MFTCHNKIIIRMCNRISLYNVVVSPEDMSLRKKKASIKETDEIEEDGTTGMMSIRKNLKNNVSNEKYVSI